MLELVPMPRANEHLSAHMDRRVFAFLRDSKGASEHREKIMARVGLVRDDGVTEFVEFQNSILRLNKALRQHGYRIGGGFHDGEFYWLEKVDG